MSIEVVAQPMSAPPGTPPNPFEILGLDRSASFEDVKLAYRRLARQYHPDANPNDPAALERFTALRRAYERLKMFYHPADQPLATTGPTGPTAAAPIAGSGSLAARVQRSTGPMPPNVVRPARDEQEQHHTPTSGPLFGQGHPARESAPTPSISDTGNRSIVPEPGIPGTGSRRAFYRSGVLRPSSEVVMPPERGRTTGEQGRAEESIGVAGRAPVPAPQLFGSGHIAARAELIRGQASVAPEDKPLMYYALLGLRASESVVFPRVPLNLCLVLDHSSSMLRGGKVERLKETVRAIIGQLDEEDILSIVTFGDRAEVLLPAQPLRNRALVGEAIDAIHCRGGTEISRGLTAGLSELARNASRALSHLILLTDGQTSGDEKACLDCARDAIAMNVGITAFGLGADWNSMLLDGIAGPTGGHSDYIESPEEMARAFIERVASLQATTLHRVTLSIRTVEGHYLQRATLVSPVLRPLDSVDGPSTPAYMVGDLSSNGDHRILLEFVLGPRHIGTTAVATLTLRYDVPGLQRVDETLTIPITVTARPDHDNTAPVDPRVTEALRHMTIHRLQQQAWSELITTGDLVKGTMFLKRAAEHLEAAGRPDLAAVALAEATRIESGEVPDVLMTKRLTYGTRKLASSR